MRCLLVWMLVWSVPLAGYFITNIQAFIFTHTLGSSQCLRTPGKGFHLCNRRRAGFNLTTKKRKSVNVVRMFEPINSPVWNPCSRELSHWLVRVAQMSNVTIRPAPATFGLQSSHHADFTVAFLAHCKIRPLLIGCIHVSKLPLGVSLSKGCRIGTLIKLCTVDPILRPWLRWASLI